MQRQISKNYRRAIYRKFDGLCAYTGRPLPPNWTIDHVRPKSFGGGNNYRNLLPALRLVNQYKADMTVEEFRQWLIFNLTPEAVAYEISCIRNPGAKTQFLRLANAFGVTTTDCWCGVFYFEEVNNERFNGKNQRIRSGNR